MEQEKKKNGVNVLLVVIIAILAVLCVLFATGTISFKSNESDDSQPKEDISDTDSVVSKVLYTYELEDDLNTEFKIYQIGKVFVAAVSKKGRQCFPTSVLIYSSDGVELKQYKHANINVENDIINVEYTDSDLCLSAGSDGHTIKYKVVGSNIVEQ